MCSTMTCMYLSLKDKPENIIINPKTPIGSYFTPVYSFGFNSRGLVVLGLSFHAHCYIDIVGKIIVDLLIPYW